MPRIKASEQVLRTEKPIDFFFLLQRCSAIKYALLGDGDEKERA